MSVFRCLSTLFLQTVHDRYFTILLNNLLQHLVSFNVRKLFLISNLKSCCKYWCTTPLPSFMLCRDRLLTCDFKQTFYTLGDYHNFSKIKYSFFNISSHIMLSMSLISLSSGLSASLCAELETILQLNPSSVHRKHNYFIGLTNYSLMYTYCCGIFSSILV